MANKTKKDSKKKADEMFNIDVPPCVCDNQCLDGLDQKDIDKALEEAPIVDGPFVPPSEEAKKAAKEFLDGPPAKSRKDEQPKPKNGDEQFGLDCYNLDIDAKKCFAESERHPDNTIVEFLRSINRKILNEVRTGGYSTNITFRVLPNDWVNVTHIMDWYKSRGFQVLNYEAASPAYVNEGSAITHTFTISWAKAD